MNKIVITAIALATMITGCSKPTRIPNIDADIAYKAQTTTPQIAGYTPGAALPDSGLSLPSVTTAFATDSKTYLTEYAAGNNTVTNVYLKTMSLQMPTAENQTFDFLNDVQVYISARSLPEVLVCSNSTVPKGTNALDLTTNPDIDLTYYYQKDTVYVRITGRINAIPGAGAIINVASTLHVTAVPVQ